MGRKAVHLFITGGYDSTFMLCKMSRRSLLLQPIYVFNKGRDSREYELGSIKKILKILSSHPDTKAKIAPIRIIDLDNLKIDSEINAARRSLCKKIGHLGWQYDYLATIAKDIGMVGVGIEYSPPEGDTGETEILSNYTRLIPDRLYGFIIDKEASDPAVKTVFEHMFFPIADITEPEMQNWAKENGYDEVMHSTWFCHSPIDNLPCGLCPPCEEKMGSKMEHLLPEESKRRYYRAKKCDVFGRRLSRKIKKLKSGTSKRNTPVTAKNQCFLVGIVFIILLSQCGPHYQHNLNLF